jgi:hypothetical protein
MSPSTSFQRTSWPSPEDPNNQRIEARTYRAGWLIKVENMFARLKYWRRLALRYDRCAHTLHSVACLD